MRIAICDDDRDEIYKIQNMIFAVQGDYRVDPFLSGTALLKAAEDGAAYDLLFCDIYMKEENGIDWEYNHFVVCDGFKGNKVYLNDPAKGNYTVSVERFDESFTGICLLIEPGEGFEPGGKPKSVMAFARKRLQGAEAALTFVVVTTVISSLIGILSAGFSRVFLDELLTGKEPGWFVPFLVGLGLLTGIELIVAWIQAIYSLRLNGKMAVVGNSTYMWKVLRLPMEFYSQRMAGDIQ